MHPRRIVGRFSGGRARQSQELLAFVRERGDGPPARRRRALRARPRHELLGRIVERDDAPPRSAALPRRAARRATRGRHPALRRCTSTAIRRRPVPSARPAIDALVDVVVGALRAAAAAEPVLRDRPAALRRAAVARRSQAGAGARQGQARAGAHRRRRLVLAGGRAARARRASTIACACWRRSIRWCGTAADSNYSGAGRIASRPTRRWRSASSATTRCRCCGATASSAGPTCRCATACCSTSSASPSGRPSELGVHDGARRRAGSRPHFLGHPDRDGQHRRARSPDLSPAARSRSPTRARSCFPTPAITKLDLARYYLAVAEGALRGAGGRPNVLVRYPNGIGGEFFYQKRAPDVAARRGSRSSRCSFRRAAPPRRSCRATPRRSPGWPTSPASSCTRIRCAPTTSIIPTSCASISIRCPASSGRRSARSPRVVRAALDDLGLIGWPKTSGSRGIHVYVRIERRWTFDRGAARRAGARARGRAPRARRSPPASGGRKSATASSSTTTRTPRTAPSPAPTRCGRSPTRASRRR